MKHQRPHRNKYDRRGYWERHHDEVEFQRQRVRNYYGTRIKKLKTSRVSPA